jgi:4-diphosphocytidyl-2-C-methyl-D-erythritol kinase
MSGAERLSEPAPGKVNLCLYVGRPRADGYHPLVSVVQPVSLVDTVYLEPGGERDEVVCPGVDGENLAARAISLFRERTGWAGPPFRVTIDKRIPVAAGMGGGSADAAATLRLLARHSGHAIPDALAFALGADVPVQLAAVRSLMTGAGERVEPLGPGPDEAYVVLPAAGGLSTPAVYRRADELGTPRGDLAEIERRVRADPAAHFHNDLQGAAVDLEPGIEQRLRALEDAGARAMVSGSGPTVFGVVEPGRSEAVAAAVGGIPVAAFR